MVSPNGWATRSYAGFCGVHNCYAICRESVVCGNDGQVLSDGLCYEQTIERISLVQGEVTIRQSMVGIQTKDTRTAVQDVVVQVV
jgi:hypothetical protein